MTILGQGLLTDLSPYLHVGYTAAHAPIYAPPTVGPDFPTALMVCGLLLLVTGALVPWLMRTRWSGRMRWGLSTGLIAVGFLAGLVAFYQHRMTPPRETGSPQKITMKRAQFILDWARRKAPTWGSEKPPDLQEVVGTFGHPKIRIDSGGTGRLRDYWGRDFVYKSVKVNEQSAYSEYRFSVLSKGPDGIEGSDDDILIE